MKPVYEIEKTYRFEASHSLPEHKGKCYHLNGHSYRVRVVLRSDGVQALGPAMGMVRDYADIDAVIEPLIEAHLDHKLLNTAIKGLYPTAENLARWLYHQARQKLPEMQRVGVSETEKCWAWYGEEEGENDDI